MWCSVKSSRLFTSGWPVYCFCDGGQDLWLVRHKRESIKASNQNCCFVVFISTSYVFTGTSYHGGGKKLTELFRFLSKWQDCSMIDFFYFRVGVVFALGPMAGPESPLSVNCNKKKINRSVCINRAINGLVAYWPAAYLNIALRIGACKVLQVKQQILPAALWIHVYASCGCNMLHGWLDYLINALEKEHNHH